MFLMCNLTYIAAKEFSSHAKEPPKIWIALFLSENVAHWATSLTNNMEHCIFLGVFPWYTWWIISQLHLGKVNPLEHFANLVVIFKIFIIYLGILCGFSHDGSDVWKSLGKPPLYLLLITHYRISKHRSLTVLITWYESYFILKSLYWTIFRANTHVENEDKKKAISDGVFFVTKVNRV